MGQISGLDLCSSRSTLPVPGADLIDEIHQVWVSWGIFQVVAAFGLLVASTTDTAETHYALRALRMDILILGVLAHP
jgi:hypothetical protein